MLVENLFFVLFDKLHHFHGGPWAWQDVNKNNINYYFQMD